MSLRSGKRFGRYELVSKLGYGGMAETWLARMLGEAGFSKSTVIKKVLPEYSDDYAFTSMLISEARICATLSHNNIAQVFDFGRVDNEYFLAMEFVDGPALHEVIYQAIRSGWQALPVPPAVFIGIEMCRGLHYAHTRKDESGKPLSIVHRDISPENVLVSYEGQVKVVDFGLAKARELGELATEPGVVKGKYLFFSPEQARGEQVDARTDVWAAGITLYEALCGKLPVEGPEFAVLPKLSKGEFPRPREINPKLPQELEDILMGALAVRREDRYQSSRAFGDALSDFLFSIAPRFSELTLSHFVQDLFREKMSRDGRDIQVPRSFQEELASWRGEPRAAAPAEPPVAPAPAPAPAPARPPTVSTPDSVRLTDPAGSSADSRAPGARWKWSVAGGTALGWLALGAFLLVDRKPSPPAPMWTEPTAPTAVVVGASSGPVLRSSKPSGPSEDCERFLQEARQAMSSSRYEAAEDNFRAALRINPESLEAKEGLGLALVLGHAGEASNEQAVKLLRDVVKEDAIHARGWFALGMALQGLQHDAEATEAYKKYLMLEPAGRFAPEVHRALQQLGAE
ncbi:MAG: protein kinase domain-containing protein [Hyalangium sp.]|uniref:protein kinase domain-containing protein n=1 Tax=Hyalangium sp. TaxID=2028555 RepID=UPI003899AF9E